MNTRYKAFLRVLKRHNKSQKVYRASFLRVAKVFQRPVTVKSRYSDGNGTVIIKGQKRTFRCIISNNILL